MKMFRLSRAEIDDAVTACAKPRREYVEYAQDDINIDVRAVLKSMASQKQNTGQVQLPAKLAGLINTIYPTAQFSTNDTRAPDLPPSSAWYGGMIPSQVYDPTRPSIGRSNSIEAEKKFKYSDISPTYNYNEYRKRHWVDKGGWKNTGMWLLSAVAYPVTVTIDTAMIAIAIIVGIATLPFGGCMAGGRGRPTPRQSKTQWVPTSRVVAFKGAQRKVWQSTKDPNMHAVRRFSTTADGRKKMRYERLRVK
jgi:hypothetical protein